MRPEDLWGVLMIRVLRKRRMMSSRDFGTESSLKGSEHNGEDTPGSTQLGGVRNEYGRGSDS